MTLGKVYYEVQTFEHGEVQTSEQCGSWFFTLTLTRGEDHWTSKPIRLRATNSDDAKAEAVEQARTLYEVLK